MSDKTKPSWGRIAGSSALVSVCSLALLGAFWRPGAMSLLLALFLLGLVGGAVAGRHGWLAGVIVGLPFSFFQMTRMASSDMGGMFPALSHPDYWRLALPACVVASGMAIAGGMCGAWLRGIRLQRMT